MGSLGRFSIWVLGLCTLFLNSPTTVTAGGDSKMPSLGDEPDRFARRAEWLHKRRAYPLNDIPSGARARALEHIRQAKANRAPTAAGPLLEWLSFGPEPIRSQNGQELNAGRVTTIAIDPVDANHWFIGAAQGGIWETWNAGASWRPRTDDQASLAMGAIVFAPGNPQIIYAGTGEANFSADSYAGAGLLKSLNRGSNWFLLATNRFAQTAFSDVRVHPTLPDILMAATARGILGPVAAGTNIPPTAPPRGVFKSTDGGTNWSQKLWGEATDLEVVPGDFSRQYAALGEILGSPTNGVYRSINSGDSWSRIDGPWAGLLVPTNIGRIELAIAPSQSNTLYVSVARKRGLADNALLGIWRTDTAWDPTPSWSLISSFGTPDAAGNHNAIWYYHELSVHPTNPSLVLWGGFDLWRYNGSFWTAILPLNGHVDQHAIAWRPVSGGYRFVLGNDGGVLSAFEDLSNWANHNQDLAITQFYEGSVHLGSGDDLVLGGSQDNGTEVYNGGLEWDQIDCCDGGDNAISASQPDKHWAVSFQTWQGVVHIRRTKDGAATTPQDASSGISGANAPFFVRFEKHPTLDDLFIAGTVNMWKCANFFSASVSPSWVSNGPVLNKPNGQPAEITALVFAPSDSSGLTYAYGTEDGQLRITANGGMNWSNLDPANAVPGRYITDLAFDPKDATILYVTLSGFDEGTPSAPGHLFRTVNALAATPMWMNISPPVNLPHNTIAIDPSLTSFLYVGTDIGVWVSQNDGADWSHMGPESGMPNVAVYELQMDNNGGLTAFTHGRGAFVLRFKLPKIYEVACPLPCQLGWVNPLDLVSIDLTLRCTFDNTVNLVASLRPTEQITPKSGKQSYGALEPNGTPVSKSFTFQAGNATGGGGAASQCGQIVTAIFDLEDEGRSLGSVDVSFRLGRPAFPLSEDLERAIPPRLPENWRSVLPGAGTPWTTTSNPPPNSIPGPSPDHVSDPASPRSIHNIAFFAPAPDVSSDNILYSPLMQVTRPFAELSFRHSFSFEQDMDAGVLEISIDGGPFTDIERALGRFDDGGYNTVVRADTALLGRRAWSGDSGGYFVTRLMLPASVADQNIQLRWRCVTDLRGAGQGWWVDDVELLEFECATPVIDPVIVRPRLVRTGFAFSFDTVRDRTYLVECRTRLDEPAWQLLQSIIGDGLEKTVTVDIIPPHRFYRFRVE